MSNSKLTGRNALAEKEVEDIVTKLVKDALTTTNGHLGDSYAKIDITPVVLSANAMTIMEKRYLLKDAETEKILETPIQLFARVALKLALIEIPYNIKNMNEDNVIYHVLRTFAGFFAVMRDGHFIPAGRTLANDKFSVPNCIVLHPEDNMDSIFQVLHDAAMLQKAGCGLGFPLHLMRPTGDTTYASGGQSSGPISFLHVYNTAFGVIKQQNRHGANMAIMRVTHPDILEFIKCKQVEGQIRNFNISVALSNEFMERVKSNDPRPWLCTFNGVTYPLREITRNGDNFTSYTIKEVVMTAKELFQEILKYAHNNGEPGCVFLDRVNETNPLPGLGDIESSNPCGEQFLGANDVCNLGSINLASMIDDSGKLDESKLAKAASIGINMLDNAIDTFKIPVKAVQDMALKTRRCGLGILGFAEYLLQRGIPYDSEEALQEIDTIMQIIQKNCIEESRRLAESKGVFPAWPESIYAPANDRRRNAYTTSIAPTGKAQSLFIFNLLHSLSLFLKAFRFAFSSPYFCMEYPF